MDLLVEMGARHGLWAIEIKRTSAPKLERGFRSALDDIKPTKACLVYGDRDQIPLGGGVEAISLLVLTAFLAALS